MGADQHLDWHSAAASALQWWRDAGVDVLVDEEPRDWLPRPQAPPALASPAPEAAPADTLPDTLDAFLAWRMSAAAPDHGVGAMVAAKISPGAAVMLLVDMPETEDAATGVLVSGASGRLLDRMLAAIGLDRETVHLVPLCAVRPVTGRINPEIEAPLARAARQLMGLLEPRAVLALGTAAARALAGEDASAARGGLRQINHAGRDWPVIASFHPRFLLERPAAKAEAWKHLQMLNREIRRA